MALCVHFMGDSSLLARDSYSHFALLSSRTEAAFVAPSLPSSPPSSLLPSILSRPPRTMLTMTKADGDQGKKRAKTVGGTWIGRVAQGVSTAAMLAFPSNLIIAPVVDGPQSLSFTLAPSRANAAEAVAEKSDLKSLLSDYSTTVSKKEEEAKAAEEAAAQKAATPPPAPTKKPAPAPVRKGKGRRGGLGKEKEEDDGWDKEEAGRDALSETASVPGVAFHHSLACLKKGGLATSSPYFSSKKASPSPPISPLCTLHFALSLFLLPPPSLKDRKSVV